MSLRIKAGDIASLKNRQLFFDANVLLYLFGSVGISSNQWAINAYSTIFNHCLRTQSSLCVDILVLSEFINRFLRLEYENYLKAGNIGKSKVNFKKFRSKTEGIAAAKDVESIVKGKILKRFTVIGKLFNNSDISSINFANTDFNDALIIKACKEHQCVLVTNDADFSGADIDILTANNKMLL